MQLGRVYRRQDLIGFSTAVDRDLKTLIDDGEVEKSAWGLYCRSHKKLGTVLPPDERELVRAFLKSDDFLLTSDLVYNHKRAGNFLLGGRRFKFHIVRSYPQTQDSGGKSVVRESMPLHIVPREDERSDLRFWLGKPAEERIGAMEFLREQYYALSGYKSLPRLAHAVQVRAREA